MTRKPIHELANNVGQRERRGTERVATQQQAEDRVAVVTTTEQVIEHRVGRRVWLLG